MADSTLGAAGAERAISARMSRLSRYMNSELPRQSTSALSRLAAKGRWTYRRSATSGVNILRP